jgi:hypothetical protein
MEEINDSIVIKLAETDEELCGRGYVHCTAWTLGVPVSITEGDVQCLDLTTEHMTGK